MLAHLPTTLFFLLASIAVPTSAGIQQSDFSGIGHIYVIKSDDWQTATPDSTVGCLNTDGKFVSTKSHIHKCGVFERLESFPYTLSTGKGNCTFEDQHQEKNTDSYYGKSDSAWSCVDRVADIYDELYTIDGFPYVFLCFGDVACYYDAKKAPSPHEALPLWQFRWGSQQMGITPGHIQLQLMWKKIGDLPGKPHASEVLGPRVQISEGMQMPLMGKKARE